MRRSQDDPAERKSDLSNRSGKVDFVRHGGFEADQGVQPTLRHPPSPKPYGMRDRRLVQRT